MRRKKSGLAWENVIYIVRAGIKAGGVCMSSSVRIEVVVIF